MNVVKSNRPVDAWEQIIENFLIKKPEWFGEGIGYNLTDSLFTYDLVVEISEAKFENLILVSYLDIPLLSGLD